MTNSPAQRTQRLHDQFGRRVAARLSEGSQSLPHDVSERLRAARVRAVASRKPEPIVSRVRGFALAGFNSAQEHLGFWGRLASALPVVVLAAGLVAIHLVQNEIRASEVAEVDAALLTDDLPPAAYADPGFAQFLKTGQ
ncbi:DUF3619 family protein [Ramlibacter sp. MAHUQ-53]|uniref:DUF3619 family protein n=1 Tax=unclassified Ramlibacter TaxID=2617605 RepID=UPI00363C0182